MGQNKQQKASKKKKKGGGVISYAAPHIVSGFTLIVMEFFRDFDIFSALPFRCKWPKIIQENLIRKAK